MNFCQEFINHFALTPETTSTSTPPLVPYLTLSASPLPPPPYYSVFVGNIQPDFTPSFIASLFPLVRPSAIQMRRTPEGEPAHFCFALFETEQLANDCIETYRGKSGRLIRGDGHSSQHFAYKVNQGRARVRRDARGVVPTPALDLATTSTLLPTPPITIDTADSPRSPRDPGQAGGCLYAGDLGDSVTDAQLLVHFQRQFRSAREARIVRHATTGASRRYGFVSFTAAADAVAAVAVNGGRVPELGASAVVQIAQHQNYSLRAGPTPAPSAGDVAGAVLAGGGRDGVSAFSSAAPASTLRLIVDETVNETAIYDRLVPEFGVIARIRVVRGQPRSTAYVTFATRSAALLCAERYAPRCNGQCMPQQPPFDSLSAAADAVDRTARVLAARLIPTAPATATGSPVPDVWVSEGCPAPMPFPDLQKVRQLLPSGESIANTITTECTAAAVTAMLSPHPTPATHPLPPGTVHPLTIGGCAGVQVGWAAPPSPAHSSSSTPTPASARSLDQHPTLSTLSHGSHGSQGQGQGQGWGYRPRLSLPGTSHEPTSFDFGRRMSLPAPGPTSHFWPTDPRLSGWGMDMGWTGGMR